MLRGRLVERETGSPLSDSSTQGFLGECLREASGCDECSSALACNMKARNRKTSPELQKQANPGAPENARAYRTGNPSGRENMSMPQGRGGTSSDHSATEKQNQ